MNLVGSQRDVEVKELFPLVYSCLFPVYFVLHNLKLVRYNMYNAHAFRAFRPWASQTLAIRSASPGTPTSEHLLSSGSAPSSGG